MRLEHLKEAAAFLPLTAQLLTQKKTLAARELQTSDWCSSLPCPLPQFQESSCFTRDGSRPVRAGAISELLLYSKAMG